MRRLFLILAVLCATAAPAVADTIAYPVATLTGLDKITGRITIFDVYINETVQFGALQITPRVCYKRPTNEVQRTSTFLEVDQVSLQGTIRRIFTGWMFADSPALNAVDHPVYDVWLTDCKQSTDIPPPDLRGSVAPEAQFAAPTEEPAIAAPQLEPDLEAVAEPATETGTGPVSESSIITVPPPQ